jgi:hypothetical protein
MEQNIDMTAAWRTCKGINLSDGRSWLQIVRYGGVLFELINWLIYGELGQNGTGSAG